MKQIPEIRNDNGIQTLYVHGEPFFALAGELHNSSASDLTYMEREIWPRLKGLNMNSVIVPLYWETVEPEEGRYDFTLLDGLVRQARENQMHLIFLWFGLWKNAESMYVPSWMKKDTETYFRARKINGEPLNTISPLCQAAVEKDRRAFTALMSRIRELDEEKNTVIFMQVENEIGLLGTERDYSDIANTAFDGPVPKKLAEAFNRQGTWREVFGTDAEESFMAWHFASAVERITFSGREAYPLPCYTNTWLKQYPWFPGSYPSGGPVKEMHPIWRIAAPSLFAFGPDIYVPYCAQILDEYHTAENPLVIPEIRKDAVTASYCLYAFGKHNAICYSPFGIEEMTMDPSMIDVPPMDVMIALNIDPSAFDIAGSKDHLAATYDFINQVKPLYLKYRGTDRLYAYVRKGEWDYGCTLKLTNYDLQIAYSPRISGKPLSAGWIMELDENRFLLAGMQSSLTFRPKPGVNRKVEVLRLEEGKLEDGRWKPGRILNGDEKMSLRLGEQLTVYMLELFQY